MDSEEQKKFFAAVAASYADDVKREEHYRDMITGPLINGCIWVGVIAILVAMMAVKPHNYDSWDMVGVLIWAGIGVLLVANNILCVIITRRYFKERIDQHLKVREMALNWKDEIP